jgi:hypothetical protein
LLGDFNLPNIIWSQNDNDKNVIIPLSSPNSIESSFINDLNSLHFSQFNFVFNNKNKMLDLVFSNSIHLDVIETDNLLPLDLFHPALNISFQIDKLNFLSFSETYFDFNSGDYISINNYLSSINWYQEFKGLELNDAISHFYNFIYEAIHLYIPLRTYHSSKYKIWFSNELKNLIRRKKLAHLNFKNHTVNEIIYYFQIFENNVKVRAD